MENTRQKVRYKLTKNDRLRSVKLIDTLFTKGKRKISGCLIAYYLEVETTVIPTSLQIMAVVSRKRFKRAVHRNILKRRIRETYRLNKHTINENLEKQGKKLIVAFVYRRNEILPYSEIKKAVVDILNFLKRV